MASSILLTTKGTCYICGRRNGTDCHHIFGAANRRLSDADGLTVYLCRECHRAVHEYDTAMRDYLHREGQTAWEGCYGNRVDFVKRYGKNYMEGWSDDEDDE